jgi:hypothetical protein
MEFIDKLSELAAKYEPILRNKRREIEAELGRRKFMGDLTLATVGIASLGTGFVLEGCTTSWIDVALKDLPVIVNIATTVATIVADALSGGVLTPAIAAIISTAATAVNAALTVVSQLVATYQANPSASIITKIQEALTTVQSNLQAILNAAHIDNPALQATITGIIGLALSVVSALISILPAPALPASASRTTVLHAAKLPSAGQLKSQANSILAANGYAQYELK